MDWLTFISNGIRDIAWPIVVLVLFKAVLGNLSQVSKFIKSVRYGDLEINLRDIMDDVRENIDEVSEKISVTNADEEGFEQKNKIGEISGRIEQLATIDPAIAVMEIYRSLEVEIVKMIQHEGYMRWVSPQRFIQHLHKEGKIDDKEVKVFDDLRLIRNAAVHSRDDKKISLAEVREFQGFVNTMLERFRSIENPLGNFPLPPTTDHIDSRP